MSLLLGMAPEGFCGDNAVTKLGRGIVNILSAPGEMGMLFGRVNAEDKNGEAMSLTKATTSSIAGTFSRLAAGIYETITFPLPNGKKGYGPVYTSPFGGVGSKAQKNIQKK